MSSNAFVKASGNNILDITGTLRMRNSGTALPVKFFDDNNNNSVDIQAPSTVISNPVGGYKLPAAAPTVAGLSLLSDTAGNMSWGNPIGSLACLDVSNVDVSGLIVNVDLSSSQVPLAIGTCVEYTAARDISNGSICVTDISNGKVMATNPTSVLVGAQFEKLIGVAIEDAPAGQIVKILEEGYCTVRCDNVPPPTGPTIIELDGVTSGNTFTLGPSGTVFTDDGGTGSGYSAASIFNITFDAGVGNNVIMTLDSTTSWEFELGATTNTRPPYAANGTITSTYGSMFDRLGMQESPDGITFTNVSVPGMEQSNIPTAAGSTNGGQTRVANTNQYPFYPQNGYIFPQQWVPAAGFIPYTRPPQALYPPFPPGVGPAIDSNNNSPNPIPNESGEQIDVNNNDITFNRFVRFYFRSDNSVQASGWNLKLRSNASPAGTLPVDALLYLSAVDLQNATTNPQSGIPIGYVLGSLVVGSETYAFARIHDR